MSASRLARRGLQLTVKSTAEGLDLLRPRRPGLTILIYHRIGTGTVSEVDLPVETFDAQMAELAASGRVRALDAALDLLTAGQPDADNPNPVVITFDDGTADLADHALPVLQRHGLPATLYVATRFVDEQVPFPGDGKPLSWSAVADLQATGLITIGSHTHSHSLLDRLPPAEVAHELDRSIELIGQNTGVAPRHFAYPKAVPGSAAAAAAVRARFASATIAGTRPNPFGATDVHQLHRSPIQASDGMHWFRRKCAGGMRFEDDLRTIANRRRYAGQTT